MNSQLLLEPGEDQEAVVAVGADAGAGAAVEGESRVVTSRVISGGEVVLVLAPEACGASRVRCAIQLVGLICFLCRLNQR